MKIERLRTNDAADARAFLRTHYGPAFYGADQAYFDWLYQESPCAWFASARELGEIPVNVVRDEAGAIGAIHAFVPFDAATPWGGTRGVWDLEWINGSGIRGAGRALASHLLAGVDVYLGYGCNDLSAKAFAAMGLEVLPEIPRVVFLHRPDELLHLMAEAGIEIPSAPLPTDSRCDGMAWSRLPNAADIGDALLKAHAARHSFGATRSRDWLAWRFDRHPHIDYHVVSGGAGAAILRLEEVLDSRMTVLRLLEFYPEPDGEGPLLGAVLAFAQENGCLLTDYFGADDDSARRLMKAGESLTGVHPAWLPPLPYRFQPLAGGAGSVNLVRAAGGLAPAGAPMAGFHATKADANQDILRRLGSGAELGNSGT